MQNLSDEQPLLPLELPVTSMASSVPSQGTTSSEATGAKHTDLDAFVRAKVILDQLDFERLWGEFLKDKYGIAKPMANEEGDHDEEG